VRIYEPFHLLKAVAEGRSHHALTTEADANLRSNDACFPLLKDTQRDVDVVKLLLDNNAEFEARDRRGFTPLLSAAERGHTDVVKLLLDKGADVNSLSYRNESSLLIAASSGYINVMRELISAGADVNIRRNEGISPLHAAIEKGFIDVVKMLLENNNQHGADVNTADIPLHSAVRHGLDVVQLLVQHGAKVNVQNIEGETLLHIAVRCEQSEVIMFLLSQGADVGLTDVWRNTPLHYVTCELLKQEALAKYIANTNLSIRNAMGVSAKEHCEARGLSDFKTLNILPVINRCTWIATETHHYIAPLEYMVNWECSSVLLTFTMLLNF